MDAFKPQIPTSFIRLENNLEQKIQEMKNIDDIMVI